MNKFIFGKNSVLDAIKNNFPIKKLYLSKNIKLQNTNLPIIYCDNMQLNKLVNGNHQGYIAEIEEYKYFDFGNIQKDKPNIVLIFTHIIIPKDRACEVTPTVLKTSSGGFNNLKIIKVASLFDTISNLKELGF